VLRATVLAAVSQIDGRRGLPARVRFAAHRAAVAIFVWAHPAPGPLWLLAAVSFFLLWLVNLWHGDCDTQATDFSASRGCGKPWGKW
jgi:hypothetical protein